MNHQGGWWQAQLAWFNPPQCQSTLSKGLVMTLLHPLQLAPEHSTQRTEDGPTQPATTTAGTHPRVPHMAPGTGWPSTFPIMPTLVQTSWEPEAALPLPLSLLMPHSLTWDLRIYSSTWPAMATASTWASCPKAKNSTFLHLLTPMPGYSALGPRDRQAHYTSSTTKAWGLLAYLTFLSLAKLHHSPHWQLHPAEKITYYWCCLLSRKSYRYYSTAHTQNLSQPPYLTNNIDTSSEKNYCLEKQFKKL